MTIIYYYRVGDKITFDEIKKTINKEVKQIEDFPDYYITNDGEIWSYKNKYKSRKGLRLLLPCKSTNGYYRAQLVDGKRHKWYMLHRLVAYYFCEVFSKEPL